MQRWYDKAAQGFELNYGVEPLWRSASTALDRQDGDRCLQAGERRVPLLFSNNLERPTRIDKVGGVLQVNLSRESGSITVGLGRLFARIAAKKN